MSFPIVLQNNKSENNRLDKIVEDLLTVTGTLRENTSIVSPTFIIEARPEDIEDANYLTVSEFGRKYYINNVTALRSLVGTPVIPESAIVPLTQSGSGTVSPENVRDYVTYDFSFFNGVTAGTLDTVNKTFTVTWRQISGADATFNARTPTASTPAGAKIYITTANDTTWGYRRAGGVDTVHCNTYPNYETTSPDLMRNETLWLPSATGNVAVCIRDDSVEQASELNNIQLVYQLAEPIVFNLTDAQVTEVLTALGYYGDIKYLYAFDCSTDVLSTYAEEIRANRGIVFRSEKNYNLYLNDGSLVAYQDPYILTEPFPFGFTGACFILSVAGA